MIITRRSLLTVTAGGLAASSFGGLAWAAELPKLKTKDKYKVGFAQTESNNPWRLAQTASMKDEAAKRGWQLVYTDAAGSAAKQVADVRSMIAQKVDVILLAPREEKPLVPAVMEAKNAGIPLFCIDRSVDPTMAKAGRDYVAFIGSDFVKEGQMAGEAFAKAVGGKAKIIELQGTTGSSPANDRMKGFKDAISKFPDMVIVASQSGDFARDKGRQVFETLYQAHPEATALYGHNDEMSMGAIAAMEAAGKVPGKDIMIVSIDGTKDAAQAVADGKIAVLVECNPHFGPKAFSSIVDYAGGMALPASLVNTDRLFTKENIASYMPKLSDGIILSEAALHPKWEGERIPRPAPSREAQATRQSGRRWGWAWRRRIAARLSR